MGKKSKEGSVNLYYLKNQDEKKNKSVSKNNIPKNNSLKTKKVNGNNQKIKNNKFNFDDEIVIGVTKKQDNKNNKANLKKNNSTGAKKVQAKNKTQKEKKNNNFVIFKYVFIICAILASIICFMISPIFNIKEIKIKGNNKVSKEEITSLSEIKLEENIYKINETSIISKIKQNAYIENASIKRKLPSVIEIEVKERQATYMLEYVNSYAYINNQGYMLEISDAKIEKPIITGISTTAENIKTGNRLVEEDLIKLEEVLKIMESATSNEVESFINKIDITDKNNYILYMDIEGKIVRFGDVTDISTKMLHIKKILEKEAGVNGEIIVDSVSKDSKSRFVQKIN